MRSRILPVSTEDFTDLRSQTRHLIKLQVRRISDRSPINVLLQDISVSGALVETSGPLTPGEVISFELPVAGITPATIVWSSERLHGCQFDEPISSGAVSAARLQGQAARAVTESPEAEHIGDRLRRFRKAKGISLKALGQALGVSSVTIYNWEAGKRNPRGNRMNAIAQVLGVNPANLVGTTTGDHDTAPEPNGQSGTVQPGFDLKTYLMEAKRHIANGAGVSFESVAISITY